MTATTVISKLKAVFARFGVPFELVSDHGPQLTSDAFAQFALCHGFSHITSDPYLPQANGAAEQSVQTAKPVLATSDPWLSLMIYRDTTFAATGYSPAQLLLGHHIHTNLPALPSCLKLKVLDPEQVRDNDRAAKLGYEHHYNWKHGVRPLSELSLEILCV